MGGWVVEAGGVVWGWFTNVFDNTYDIGDFRAYYASE